MTRLTRRYPFWDWHMTPALPFAASSRTAAPAYRPPMDIEEEEGQYVVTLAVPGFRRDQLTITLEDDVLRIQGSLAREPEGDEAGAGRKYHLRERRLKQFARALRLPAGVAADRIGAHYDRGILTLTIPKPEAALPQPIQIAVGEP